MKIFSFLLIMSCSTLVHAVIDKAPKCEAYFTTHQTDGNYQHLGNGLIADPLTGLTWFRCGAGQTWEDGVCQGAAMLLPFEEALTWAENAELAGNNDWRVPEIDEMTSLVETDCKSPSINTRVFSGIEPEVYWSSESNFWLRSMGWSLFFYRGYYFNKQAKTDSFRFMLVRD
ncbi:MAG: DUF1566 domain-containing protein [Oceanospirillaceae bacterium]|nr:DUF1566 domain-containing protein [Oceanospirillaceae bacterium]